MNYDKAKKAAKYSGSYKSWYLFSLEKVKIGGFRVVVPPSPPPPHTLSNQILPRYTESQPQLLIYGVGLSYLPCQAIQYTALH